MLAGPSSYPNVPAGYTYLQNQSDRAGYELLRAPDGSLVYWSLVDLSFTPKSPPPAAVENPVPGVPMRVEVIAPRTVPGYYNAGDKRYYMWAPTPCDTCMQTDAGPVWPENGDPQSQLNAAKLNYAAVGFTGWQRNGMMIRYDTDYGDVLTPEQYNYILWRYNAHTVGADKLSHDVFDSVADSIPGLLQAGVMTALATGAGATLGPIFSEAIATANAAVSPAAIADQAFASSVVSAAPETASVATQAATSLVDPASAQALNEALATESTIPVDSLAQSADAATDALANGELSSQSLNDAGKLAKQLYGAIKTLEAADARAKVKAPTLAPPTLAARSKLTASYNALSSTLATARSPVIGASLLPVGVVDLQNSPNNTQPVFVAAAIFAGLGAALYVSRTKTRRTIRRRR